MGRQKIKSEILAFYKPMFLDRNHRYKSWEHCYTYFSKPISENDIDHACLHLAFYLASWGMYRGSSDLLQKDYLIHRTVVKEIIGHRYLFGTKFEDKEVEIDGVFRLIELIREHYKKAIKEVGGKMRENPFVATDTLVTKILLGTLGCAPAYDQYFVKGMRENGISYSNLSKSNFEKVIQFYLKNQDEIDQAGDEISRYSGVVYPPMKLIDMYFWTVGNPNQA
jgi:hypothetical protein